ncbi:MAG: anti-sigma factor family protein [Bacteroidota bacterium]
MNHGKPIEENDLQAYVDRRLDPARRAEVEAYLAAHPDQAERVRAFGQQNAMLRSLFDPVLEQPVPERLPRVLASSPDRRLWRYSAMAASLAVAVMVGWILRGEQQISLPRGPSFAERAAVAHVVYTPEVLHPVEVGVAQEDHLIKWLSKRLGEPVKAPDLDKLGYHLIGGRLLPGREKPAAQFMYEDARGQRLTLYVSTDVTGNQETAFRYAREDGVSVFYWVDGPLGYALSAEAPREQLLAVAETVYRDLNR